MNENGRKTLCKDEFTNCEIVKENQQLQQELQKYKKLIDTILETEFFKNDCPLGFSWGNDTLENKAQNIFYEDDGEYCENNCNECYKKCWLNFFEEIQRLKEIK